MRGKKPVAQHDIVVPPDSIPEIAEGTKKEDKTDLAVADKPTRLIRAKANGSLKYVYFNRTN